jgi:hypothetical protein
MAQPMVQDQVRAGARPRRATSARPEPRVQAGPNASADQAHPRGLRRALERVILGVLTTLVSVNIWTGGPVFALWVGSRIQAGIGHLSETAVGATIVILALVSFVLYKVLARLNARYNAVIGRVMPRQQAPWLKPMSGERRSIEVKRPLSATERIVVGSVVVAVLVFEVWFFFFAHYTFAG